MTLPFRFQIIENLDTPIKSTFISESSLIEIGSVAVLDGIIQLNLGWNLIQRFSLPDAQRSRDLPAKSHFPLDFNFMQPLPANFELVQDPNYILKEGDLYGYEDTGFWNTVYGIAGDRLGDSKGIKVARKIEINNNIPANFELVTDLDYIIKENDYYSLGEHFYPCRSTVGDSYAQALQNFKDIKIIKKIEGQNIKPNKEISPPAGFILVKDYQDYVLKRGDKAYDDHWFTVGGWTGKTARGLWKEKESKIIAVAVKGMAAPRFVSDKPFPHGY